MRLSWNSFIFCMSKCSKKITRSGHIWYFWYFQKSGNKPYLSWKNNPSGSSLAASAELPRRCQSSMQFGQRDLSNPQGRYQSSQVRRYVLVIQLCTTRLPQKFHYYGKTEYLRAMNEIPPKSLDISLSPSLGPKRWWRDWAWPQLWRCKHAPPNPKCPPSSLANQGGAYSKWHACLAWYHST